MQMQLFIFKISVTAFNASKYQDWARKGANVE